MKVRTLLIATGLVSAILGAVVAYLVLTVPNDVQANVLMKDARAQISKGDNAKARQSLTRIVQQYPRTDAAAAAMVALATIADSEQQKLEHDLQTLRRDYTALQKQVGGMSTRVETIEKKPPPAPVVVREVVQVPAPVVKKATPKKTVPKKTTTRKRR